MDSDEDVAKGARWGGELDGDYVDKNNFGGGENPEEEPENDRKKSRKEVF